MNAEKIIVTKRHLYGSGRKRIAYDAKCRGYEQTGPTAKIAREALRRDMDYADANPGILRGNCVLTATGFESWVFVLRADNTPRSSSSMSFGAATFEAAYANIATSFADHEDARAFLNPDAR